MAMYTQLRARLGLSGSSFRVVATYYLSYIALGTVTPSLGTALPFLAERAGVTLDIASTLFSVRALGFLLGSYVTGRLLERLPAHGVIQASLLALAVVVLFLAVVPQFAWLLLILLLIGFFGAWLDVGSNILIVWQLKHRVSPFLTGLHCIWGVGALITPLIIVQLQSRTGTLVAPFAVIALIVSASALLYIRLPSPSSVQTTTNQRAPLPKVPLVTLMAMLFLAGTLEMAMSGYIVSYLLTTELSTPQVAGGVASTFYIAITCTRLVAVFLLMRFPNQTVVILALVLVTGAATIVLLLPGSLLVVWGAVICCGIGEASLFPLTLALAPQYMTAVSRATSFMFVGVSLGSLTIPLLIGHLFANSPVGPQVIWYYTLGGALLYTGCLLILRCTPQLAQSTASEVPTLATAD